ncbi:PepSY domain-containing protein [Pseudomonas typographi]|uniref:PepSY domain-containing protein n=1 Tax=Pseudomonas typographi TaxID=2715964 RepID=A0ABR7Z1G9_9PSED|nr:PepSY domain-containing protein [Pseudomonas typographi]MBD1551657.1 PepSY domain-containing protein [Pseudomonas typographi]MBD1587089.1 PepSY domain-containing protein [Pseudomonas typographi]MBD1599325.1 PepSY domain-containing protein [Pseudomonas typographi]
MKRIALFALGAALAINAYADQPGPDWISEAQARDLLKAAGYTQVTKIEADDGYWEGEGIKTDGMPYDFKVDPHSKQITEEMDM